jgi:hypothetical protein
MPLVNAHWPGNRYHFKKKLTLIINVSRVPLF